MVVELCELPPCDFVLQSPLFSERCGTKPQKWPLLITGTPRSATVFATNLLKSHGMAVQNDWGAPAKHGSVSWIFAFEDEHNFGPARTGGGTFKNVFHQVKDPLGSVASMCTEPIFTSESAFLQRHVYMPSFYEEPKSHARAALEFCVEWHTYLLEMKLPTYKVENVTARTIFQLAGLEEEYHEAASVVSGSTNARKHRPAFTWQELYTLDPRNAARAWSLAHRFGYEYPAVDFDALVCLPSVPSCGEKNVSAAPQHKCQPGTHPYPRQGINKISNKKLETSGIEGWVDGGCLEFKTGNNTYIGISGQLLLEGGSLNEQELHDAIKDDNNSNKLTEDGSIDDNDDAIDSTAGWKKAQGISMEVLGHSNFFGMIAALSLMSFASLVTALLINQHHRGLHTYQRAPPNDI